MKLDTLLEQSHHWLRASRERNDVLLGTLGRVVRSLSAYSFPGWCLDEERQEVMHSLRAHVQNVRGYKSAFRAEMSTLTWQQRRLLLERKLISPCMAARQDGCEIYIPKKQDSIIMVNEEEHIAVHRFMPGLRLDEVHERLLQTAQQLSHGLQYAYDEHRGYLTSLPHEHGDAIQLYVLLHLPALTCAGAITKLKTSLEKLELGLQPYYADDKEDTGNMFILHCHPTGHEMTQLIKTRLSKIARCIVKRELQFREQLLETDGIEIRDLIGRAFGILQYAVKLSFKEFADSMSLIRLGLTLGILVSEQEEMDLYELIDVLIELSTDLSPAHIRHLASLGVDDSTEEVQFIRAQLCRSVLNTLSIQFRKLPT